MIHNVYISSIWKIGRITAVQARDFLIHRRRFMENNSMNLTEISSNGKNAFSAHLVVLPIPFGRILQVGFLFDLLRIDQDQFSLFLK